MQHKVATTIEYTLVLTAEEADWLRGIVQNPLSNDPNPANEDPHDTDMRNRFWKALN